MKAFGITWRPHANLAEVVFVTVVAFAAAYVVSALCQVLDFQPNDHSLALDMVLGCWVFIAVQKYGSLKWWWTGIAGTTVDLEEALPIRNVEKFNEPFEWLKTNLRPWQYRVVTPWSVTFLRNRDAMMFKLMFGGGR